jgi:hypothetical protein
MTEIPCGGIVETNEVGVYGLCTLPDGHDCDHVPDPDPERVKAALTILLAGQ